MTTATGHSQGSQPELWLGPSSHTVTFDRMSGNGTEMRGTRAVTNLGRDLHLPSATKSTLHKLCHAFDLWSLGDLEGGLRTPLWAGVCMQLPSNYARTPPLCHCHICLAETRMSCTLRAPNLIQKAKSPTKAHYHFLFPYRSDLPPKEKLLGLLEPRALSVF